MVLVDFHPQPGEALVDGPQALLLKELPYFLEDVRVAREAYEKRRALAERYQAALEVEEDFCLQPVEVA
jgi:3-deoxy-7-phosphoheptulonate synthase